MLLYVAPYVAVYVHQNRVQSNESFRARGRGGASHAALRPNGLVLMTVVASTTATYAVYMSALS